MTRKFMKCTRKLMATTIQESRSRGITNGSLSLKSIATATERRKY